MPVRILCIAGLAPMLAAVGCLSESQPTDAAAVSETTDTAESETDASLDTPDDGLTTETVDAVTPDASPDVTPADDTAGPSLWLMPPFEMPDVSDAASFPAAWLAAHCHNLLYGSHREIIAIEAQALLSSEGCQDWFRRNNGHLHDLVAGVAAGELSYDPAAAVTCLQQVATLSEWLFWSEMLSRQCPDVFTGSTGLGGACLRSEECAPDAFCDHGALWDQCPGACAPVSDDACVDDVACRTGVPDQIGLCVSGGCITLRRRSVLAGVGEPCGTLAVGPKTFEVIDCQPGHGCKGDACVPIQAGVAPCGLASKCQPGYECIGGQCSPQPVKGLGEKCWYHGTEPNIYCSADDDLVCTQSNFTCIPGSDGSLGAACEVPKVHGPQLCHGGLICNFLTGTCQPPGEAGAPCVNDFQCLIGCDEDAGECVARRCDS